MKRKYIFILFGAVALFSLLLIGYMMYNSYSLPIQGEEVRKEWLCTNNKMKIVSYSNKFPYDVFSMNKIFIDGEEYSYEPCDGKQFLVAEDYYTGEPKIMEGHCSSNSDGSLTLHIDRVYSKKYNDLRNNDYVFYETDG